jgi:hypothetical protein
MLIGGGQDIRDTCGSIMLEGLIDKHVVDVKSGLNWRKEIVEWRTVMKTIKNCPPLYKHEFLYRPKDYQQLKKIIRRRGNWLLS